jgi:hypothetical protein
VVSLLPTANCQLFAILPAMAIILPNALTTPEIRVLQEFRRLNADSLPLETIKAIKHPAGGGEAPAARLVDKGYLTPNDVGFALTQKAKDFLSADPVPMFEEAGASGTTAEISEDDAV